MRWLLSWMKSLRMSEDKYSAWESLVKKTARFVAKDFPEVEEEDLENDLFVFVLETEISPDAEFVAKALYRKAVALSWEYRKVGLHLSAQYSYRTSDVRRIMDTGFFYEDWESGHLPDDCRSEDYDERLVVHSDISRAYDYLTDHYQSVLYRRYYLQEDVSAASLRKALERLTDILNHYNLKYTHDGLTSRKVISNAKARSILGSQEGGRSS